MGRWRARRRARREEQERTIRYVADGLHALLRDRVRRRMPDGDTWAPDEDELAQQAVRFYEPRDARRTTDGRHRVSEDFVTRAELQAFQEKVEQQMQIFMAEVRRQSSDFV